MRDDGRFSSFQINLGGSPGAQRRRTRRQDSADAEASRVAARMVSYTCLTLLVESARTAFQSWTAFVPVHRYRTRYRDSVWDDKRGMAQDTTMQ